MCESHGATFKNKKTLPNKKNFGNISIINQAFQRCYLKKENTRSSFLNLINNPDGDYSRYIFFYINYLIENNQIEQLAIGHHGVPLTVYKNNFFFGQDRFDNLIDELRKDGLKYN